jgi:hypothetical protein
MKAAPAAVALERGKLAFCTILLRLGVVGMLIKMSSMVP